ncbi:MAG: sulfite exporter TauE/SafE family protein [Acidobacteriia bacterium]|nr:sulfite exporter TauE/SafE family protein [Terriglobia bacterium]
MEWIAGFVIATTVGLTGMGGGSFTVPILVLAGLPTAEAVGTAMLFAAFLRLVAAPIYLRRKHVHTRYLASLLIGAVPGVLAGSWALHSLGASSWKPAVLLAVGLMLVISSLLSFVPRLRKPDFARRNTPWLALLALPIGMETGFSSAGAGALGTVLLLNFSEMPVAQVVGTDILFGIVLAIVGSAFHLGWGSVHTETLLRLSAGGLPGVLLGCALARHIASAKLRAAVAVVAVALGLQLVLMAGRSLWENRVKHRDSQVIVLRSGLL